MTEETTTPESTDTSWQDKIPESVRSTSLVQRSKDEDAFWGRVKDFDAYRGNSIQIPGVDANDEQRQEFYQKITDKVDGLMPVPNADDSDSINSVLAKLGAPEKAEGYTLGEGVELSADALSALQTTAKGSNLTKAQFRAIAKEQADAELNAGTVNGEFLKAQADELTKDWGMVAEDNYKAVVEFAQHNGAPEELMTALNDKSAKASTVKWLHSMKDLGKEGSSAPLDSPTSTPSAMAPHQAEEKLAEIYNNKDHPYHKNSHDPSHPSVVRFMELNRYASGA